MFNFLSICVAAIAILTSSAAELSIDPDVEELDLSNTTGGLNITKDGPFLVHQNLEKFACNYCAVQHIYRLVFSKLPNLGHLTMEYNGLEYIHPNAFEHNKLLVTLNLAHNNISTFNPEAQLGHLTYLQWLDLSWNLQFDMNKVNWTFPSLQAFICTNCDTKLISAQTLVRMPQIVNLSLISNDVQHIDYNALQYSTKIKIINVNYNPLKNLNVYSNSLEKMYAEGCQLQGTLNVSRLWNLQLINARSNQLTHVYDRGFWYTKMRTVLLDNNLIREFPAIVMTVNTLERFCIDNNPLQPFPEQGFIIHVYSLRKLRQQCWQGDETKQFEHFLMKNEESFVEFAKLESQVEVHHICAPKINRVFLVILYGCGVVLFIIAFWRKGNKLLF